MDSVRYHEQSNQQARLLWTIGSWQIRLKRSEPELPFKNLISTSTGTIKTTSVSMCRIAEFLCIASRKMCNSISTSKIRRLQTLGDTLLPEWNPNKGWCEKLWHCLRNSQRCNNFIHVHQLKLHRDRPGLEVKFNHFHWILSSERYIKFSRPPVEGELHPHWWIYPFLSQQHGPCPSCLVGTYGPCLTSTLWWPPLKGQCPRSQ